MNRIDPRIIKTKRQIDRALIECLSRYPFQKITVDMICAASMINRSTFYKYYTDKYDLLDRYLARILDEFRAQSVVDFVLASPTDVGSSAYKDSFERFARYLYQNRDTYFILWNAVMERRVYDEMILIIKDKITDLLRETYPSLRGNDLYTGLYAYLFAADAMTLIRWWFTNESSVTIQDVLRIMTQNMAEGLFRTFRENLIQPRQTPPGL